MTLTKVSKIISGFAFKSTDFVESGVPCIKISNVGYSEFHIKNQQFLPATFSSIHKEFNVVKGDLLIALTRPITNNTTKVCKYPSNEIGLLNQRVANIKVEKIDKQFLFAYFQTNLFKNYIRSKFSETLQPNLSPKDLGLALIPVPPSSEQHKIVEKLEELFSELDKGVENLKTAQQQLKDYRQAVLKWAFEGKLTNETVSDDELSVGWEWKTLGELVDNPKQDLVDGPFGSNLKSDEYIGQGIPVFKIQNIKVNKFVDKKMSFISEEKAKTLNRHSFKAGDLIITKLGEPLGLCCKVPEKYSYGIIVADLMRLRPSKAKVNDQYLIYAINSEVVQSQFKKITKGTTRARVNLTIVRDIQILMPNLSEQQRVVLEIESRLSVCDKMEETITASLRQAEALRQSILKRAFEGNLVKTKDKSYAI
jgi:type I restriction enzyme, S subunit